MSKLELILLGRFECLLPSGQRVSLAMRKAEALLAFLALAPGLRHPRERLVHDCDGRDDAACSPHKDQQNESGYCETSPAGCF